MNAAAMHNQRPQPCRVATSDGSRGLQSTVLKPNRNSSRGDEGTCAGDFILGVDASSGVSTRHMAFYLVDRGLKSTATFLGRYATDGMTV